MSEQEYDISSLEYDFGDPKVAELIQNAYLVNQYLAETNPSDEDAYDIATDLNRDWAKLGIRNQNTRVNGHGWVVATGDTDPDGNLILHEGSRMRFVDQDVVLYDFVMHEAPEIRDDGVTMVRKVYLYGKTLIVDAENSDNVSFEDCVVDIDLDTSVDYEGVTRNRAERWLEIYHPEEKEAILSRCVNADTEGEALLNFRDYSFDVTGMRQDATEELAKYVEVYIDESLGLERQIPYVVKIDGAIELFSGGDEGYRELDVSREHESELMYFYDIHTVYDDESQTIHPWVQGAIVSHDGERLISCRLPVASLESITSIRTFMK